MMLRTLRKQRNMSQKELSEKSKVHRVAICRIESGVIKAPRADTLQKIASALNCSIDELIQEELR